jgi:hypothetical protein
MKKGSIAILFAGLMTAGCQTYIPEDNLGATFYDVAERLAERSIQKISLDKVILVSTMVSVNDLHESDSFGKLASQMIASRLVQKG